MDTERTVVPAIRDALVAACPVVRKADPALDAVAGVAPSFVASPGSTEEASALLRAAAAYDLTVVPRGAGTGLGWGAPPAACDLVVDMSAMDQVLEHAAGDLVARVQAGATMGHLASVLAEAGQELAIDAPAEATVGGVVATGTAGPRRLPLRDPAGPADRDHDRAGRRGGCALGRQGGQERRRVRPGQAVLRLARARWG